MPLTFAHPAAVLPLFRGPLVPTALVVGAMSPDVPYFIGAAGVPVTAQSWYEPFLNATTSHSLVGAVTVSLPIAILGYVLARLAARPATMLLLERDAARWRRGPDRGLPARVGWVLFSLVLGIATHLLWDSFTHVDGFVVENVAALREPLIGSVPAFRALQHLSTVLGLIVIAAVLWRNRARLIAEPGSPARGRLSVALVGAVIAATAGAVTVIARRHGGTTVEHVLSDAALGAGLGVAAAAALAVTAWWLVRLVRREHHGSS